MNNEAIVKEEDLIDTGETDYTSDEKTVSVWNNVLSAALNIPGAKVNRVEFLQKELSKFYDDDVVRSVIENGCKNSPVNKKDIDKIAKSVIKNHTIIVTGISFATGLPGGWWMAGTIPADLAQFYYNVIVVTQKLAFLYGWPSFDDEQPSDEFVARLNTFIGVMCGVESAINVISKVANNLALQVSKRLPQIALTKYGFYTVSKQVAKWLGISLTKQTFAKSISKFIPILGGILSGAITIATFRPMAKNLKKYLADLPLAKDGKEAIVIEDDEEELDENIITK